MTPPRELALCLLVVALLCAARPSHALDPFCGLVVTESITLTSDHSCSGHGLVVGADKITIDLGGFTLSGDGGMDDAGIQLGNHTGVTIKNGTVRGFGDGIVMPIGTLATKLKLSRVTVRDNADYGALLRVNGLAVTDSAFLTNAYIGLAIEGTKAKVTASTFVGNVVAGIVLSFASKMSLSKLIVAENLGAGVVFSAGEGGTLRSSTIAGNGGNGVYLGSTFAEVSKNTIAHNTLHGILAEGLVGTSDVVGNLITGNLGSGISVAGQLDGLLLKRNRLLGNDVDGITVAADANGTIVNGNTAIGNHEDGVSVMNPSTLVSKNVANANRGRGIRVNGGAIDGGGNRARGNGPVEQCSPPIACPSPFKSKPGSTIPTCGMVVTTSITLAADMPLCSSGDGIEVRADGVTIDLNGHMLRGNRVIGQVGVFVRNQNNVKIKNGIVQGFDNGIVFGLGTGRVLDNVEARDSLTDGAFIQSEGSVLIKNSVFAQNSRHGLFLGEVTAPKVVSSFFTANFGDGLQTFAVGSAFTKVTAAANMSDGVQTRGDGSAVFQTLLAAGNFANGVQVDGTGGAAVSKSLVAANTLGITFPDPTTSGVVLSTSVIGNSANGIDIEGTVPTTIAKNTVAGNGGTGIRIGDNALAPSIVQNKAFANALHGIENTSEQTTFIKNTADANRNTGIFTVTGVTDGGGNKARHNVVVQCMPPIVCQ